MITFVFLFENNFEIKKNRLISNINIDDIKKSFYYDSQEKYIPKVIHLTYMDKSKVPQKVWDNLNRYCYDYKINFYDDEDCRQFLKTYYGESYVRKFDMIEKGAHKADFFRYCLLYIKGGIYMDIKLIPKINFNLLFNHEKPNLLYTCLGKPNFIGRNNQIFQAIIATFPRNPFIKYLIKDFFDKRITYFSKQDYLIYTKRFYQLLLKSKGSKLNNGINKIISRDVILFNEINKKLYSDEKKDRYNGYHNILYNNKHIFKSRYNDFPW